MFQQSELPLGSDFAALAKLNGDMKPDLIKLDSGNGLAVVKLQQ
jgi:hypothetical protein